MLNRKQQALVKTEAAYGTDAEPDGSNLIYATAFDPNPYQGDTQSRNRFRDFMGAYAEVNVGPFSTIQITVPLAGSGQAGKAPVYGPLLRACGLSETVSAGNSVKYQPVSEDFESCTIRYMIDGQEHKLTGARGTAVFNAEAGNFPTVQFTMTGFYNHPTNPATVAIADVVQADEIPVNEQNTVMDVHGFAACGQSLSLDMGNTVNYRNLINCEKVNLSDRVSTGQVQIDAPDLETKDYFAAVESHRQVTTGAIHLTHGHVAGNIVALSGTQAQLSTISTQEDDGIVQYQMDIRWLPDDGDDEFTLTFT